MKIYVHHYYSYELFWYFFHAVTPLEEIPTWFESNRYNKSNKVGEEVTIKFTYKNTDFTCIFCFDLNWKKTDGYHVWDYTIHHLEEKKISDRGWNEYIGKDLYDTIIPLMNKRARLLKDKISIFFIDWEPSDDTVTPLLNKLLNPKITLYKDELLKIENNQKVSFTHILWSFLYPNTIGLREYYFFADYLKYKNDYKYKINYPIRRLNKEKFGVATEIKKFNNPSFNVTLSSFTNYNDDERTQIDVDKYFTSIMELIGNENYINKRGYNLKDWGAEYNDNNMKEFMWKLLTISDVNLIHEESQGWSINEKSFMHILANKPFVPTHAGTFKFYNEILKSYNIPTKLDKLENKTLEEKVNYLDMISNDNKKWDIFVDELQETVNYYRTELLNIMHNNNGYLDNILFNNDKKSLL